MTDSSWISLVVAVSGLIGGIAAVWTTAVARKSMRSNDLLQRELIDTQKRALAAQQESIQIATKSEAAARESLELARRAADQQIAMFKRSGVFDLHNVWDNVTVIDPSKPNSWAVVKGVNALRLTASLWQNDVMDRDLLHATYRDHYVALWRNVNAIVEVIPELKSTGQALLSHSITKVYNDMISMDGANAPHTSLP